MHSEISTANHVGPLSWLIFDLMLRAREIHWGAGQEAWGVRIEPQNVGVVVHLRATLDGHRSLLEARRITRPCVGLVELVRDAAVGEDREAFEAER